MNDNNRIPRPEHPNPQFERANWKNLNGQWEFEIDKSNWGESQGYVEKEHFSQKITVPFCPESKLSGVEVKDFLNAVWYKRSVELTEEDLAGDVLLHFGAVDFECTVFVNGENAGTHRGGYSSFEMNITKWLKVGENKLTVRAIDDTRSPLQPTGKQSEQPGSYGCFYTRSTGIWQTVWMEFVPKKRINTIRLTPNAETCSVVIDADVNAAGVLKAECFYEGKDVGSREVTVEIGRNSFEIGLSEKHLWELGKGRLYDLKLTFGEDKVSSYFGLRSIAMDGMKFLLNGKSVFQRLVLDQGYYRDGIYTAPSDADLLKDIKISMEMGFNGARLHEKAFEPRFLYHCDKEGYMVWGEYANWGIEFSRPEAFHVMIEEWMELVQRDYNHPSIIGWCPLNETWHYNGRKQYDASVAAFYHVTKAIDPTRPCIDTSGGFHVVTDIYCVHDYEGNPEIFKGYYDKLMTDGELRDWINEKYPNHETYRGEPTFVSEYGGIAWNKDSDAWGYGDIPESEEAFLERFEGLTMALMNNNKMFGLCYTQLYDVEQEMNGLYSYDREPKFAPELIARVLTRPAAIEKEERNS